MELTNWIALLISAVALYVSYLFYRPARKWYRLDLGKFKEELTRRRFAISLIRARQNDGARDEYSCVKRKSGYNCASCCST